MTLRERFLKIRAAFDGTPPAAPAPPPAAPPAPPAAPSGMTSCSYNIDGGTPVYVNIADDGIPDIDMNDKVYTDQAMTTPYPDGTYKVTGTDFGFTVAGGIVTTVTDVDGKGPGLPIGSAPPAPPPPPAPTPAAPAAPPQPVTLSAMTEEQMTAMYSKFAGPIDDQMGALIIMVKALMEDRFGWKIREGQENAAIEVYKDTLATTPTVTIEQMSSVFAKAEKADEQAKVIARHEETIKLLLELTQQLVELPTEDPKTLTGQKKENFERAEKREKKFESIAAALKQVKSNN